MGSIESLAVSQDENYVYMASRNIGFEVVDISDIQNFNIKFTVKTGSCEYGQIFNDYNPNILVISNGIEGYLFYDIEDKSQAP